MMSSYRVQLEGPFGNFTWPWKIPTCVNRRYNYMFTLIGVDPVAVHITCSRNYMVLVITWFAGKKSLWLLVTDTSFLKCSLYIYIYMWGHYAWGCRLWPKRRPNTWKYTVHNSHLEILHGLKPDKLYLVFQVLNSSNWSVYNIVYVHQWWVITFYQGWQLNEDILARSIIVLTKDAPQYFAAPVSPPYGKEETCQQ